MAGKKKSIAAIQNDVKKDLGGFEFVTITAQVSDHDRVEASRKVRVQAMRDYLGKQDKQSSTAVITETVAREPKEPAQYKGRFKLKSWTHKAKTKSLLKSQMKEQGISRGQGTYDVDTVVMDRTDIVAAVIDPRMHPVAWKEQSPFSMLSGSRLDPFNSLSVALEARSERLLVHYNTMYTTNSIAINAEGTFWSKASADTAMLHSILYLIALHHDLKRGIRDSPECLYHGGEALSIINRRLGDTYRDLSDSTIAAVALLVNREVLWSSDSVKWSDFCHANVWDRKPAFSRLHWYRVNSINTYRELDSSPIFEFGLSIVEIIQNLRILSRELSSEHISSIHRLSASNLIYNFEYSLLLLNEPESSHSNTTILPLKVALYLYLYLIIRDIPNTTQLIHRFSQRLQDVLEPQIPGFWTSNKERRRWLLWILFVGCMAVTTPKERYWFIKGIQTVCQMLGLDTDSKSMTDCLKGCLWQEDSCSYYCASVCELVGFLESS